MFCNQAAWANASGEDLKNELIACFETASKGKGNTEQFLADMESEAVAKKVAFEYHLGNLIELQGTPTFRLNGQVLELQTLQEVLEAELEKA